MPTEVETRDERTQPHSAEPVVAEVVPPTPPPWRFGLRAMMALMVVCSAQFAMMNWFGVINGMLLATALCFLAFTGVFIVAVLLVRGNSVWLDRLDQIGIRLVIAMVVLIIGTVLAGGGKVALDQITTVVIRRELQKDLGLTTQHVYVIDNNNPRSALEITHVKSGGVADKAGLRETDVIIVQDGMTDRFYLDLNQLRGKDVDLHIAGKAAHQPLEKCTQWDVTVPIPAR
jgi:hypothetical protein